MQFTNGTQCSVGELLANLLTWYCSEGCRNVVHFYVAKGWMPSSTRMEKRGIILAAGRWLFGTSTKINDQWKSVLTEPFWADMAWDWTDMSIGLQCSYGHAVLRRWGEIHSTLPNNDLFIFKIRTEECMQLTNGTQSSVGKLLFWLIHSHGIVVETWYTSTVQRGGHIPTRWYP